MDQHELVISILCAAGGQNAEQLVPASYGGQRADVVFRADGVIVEVKSFTSDRRQNPHVALKLGEVMERNVSRGAPVLFGTVRIGLHDLPVPVAEQALRVVGKRVRKEVTQARRQIAATCAALDMPDAYRLLVLVTPPGRIGSQTLAWLINDALQHSAEAGGLDGAFIIETPLGLPAGEDGLRNSFLSWWAISGREFPDLLKHRIDAAWRALTGLAGRSADVEDFVALGGTP